MIWILALLCLGIGALVGYFQGPIRGIFTLLGLTLGYLLAGPLSPIFKPLLPLFGVKNVLWLHVLPSVIAFVLVVILLSVAGAFVHRKVTVGFKYGDENDLQHYRWDRFSHHVGLCTGLYVGAFYFLVILIPVYIGGYFTLELTGKEQANPTSVKLVNTLRADMQQTKMDRVIAPYDPTPAAVYQASDILALVLQNPELESRLARYPVFMALGERPEFSDLAADPEFRKLFESHKSVQDLLNYPKVQSLLTNKPVVANLSQTITNNLTDLSDYLKTGKSAKYDGEKILGLWIVNPLATYMEERKKLSNQTATQILKFKYDLSPKTRGLVLLVTTDKGAILKKENPANPDHPTVVYTGTWKKNGEKYEVNLPGNDPENVELVMRGEDSLVLPKDGLALVMDRE